MAWTERYANFDLATGLNDGTSEANAWKTPAAVIAGVAAGQRVNIKRQSAAYNLTTTVTFNVNGTATAPIWYRAYASTPGDGGIWECAYNSSGTANLSFSGTYNIVEGVWFKEGAASNANSMAVSSVNSWMIRCRADNRGQPDYGNMYRCFIAIRDGGGSNGLISIAGTNSGSVQWRDCFIQKTGSSASSTGVVYSDAYGQALSFENCVFIGKGNTNEDGIFLDRLGDARGIFVNGCRFYNFRHGINIDEEPANSYNRTIISRSLFDTMAGYGIKRTNTAGGFVQLLGNYYRACTSGFTDYATESELAENIALTADPFVDKANFDFRLNETAGGGAVIRAIVESMDPAAAAMNLYPFASWHAPAAAGGSGTAGVVGS